MSFMSKGLINLRFIHGNYVSGAALVIYCCYKWSYRPLSLTFISVMQNTLLKYNAFRTFSGNMAAPFQKLFSSGDEIYENKAHVFKTVPC